jgi:hypothetical protein
MIDLFVPTNQIASGTVCAVSLGQHNISNLRKEHPAKKRKKLRGKVQKATVLTFDP